MLICAGKSLAAESHLTPDAPSIAVKFEEQDSMILAVRLVTGMPLNDGLMAFPSGKMWYLPFLELCDSLGIKAEAEPSGRISGFVFAEEKTFSIDPKALVLEVKGQQSSLTTSDFTVFEGELFITNKIFERLFPVRLKIEEHRLELIVDSLVPLPIQLRAERERHSAFSKESERSKSGDQNNISVVNEPYTALDGFHLDQSLTTSQEIGDGHERRTFTHDTTISGEFVGMEMLDVISGTSQKAANKRMTLSRRDPEGHLLGPLGLREIRLVDVTMPQIPLLGGGVGRGFYLANKSASEATGIDANDFRGQLSPGWEVELYKNELLIERQVVGTSGVYAFENVPLEYGSTTFRLVFYGPQGQRREEKRSFYIDRSVLEHDKNTYSLGFVSSPLHEEHALADYEVGLTKGLSLAVGMGHTKNKDELVANDYGQLGLRGAYSNLFSRIDYARSSKGGSATQTSLKFPVGAVTFSAQETQFFDFESDYTAVLSDLPLKEMRSARAESRLPTELPIMTSLEARRLYYRQEGFGDEFVHRVSTFWNRVYWGHEWRRLRSVTPQVVDKWQAAVSAQWFGLYNSVRTDMDYTEKNISGYGTSAEHRFDDHNLVEMTGRRHFAPTLTQTSCQYTYQEQASSLSLRAEFENPWHQLYSAVYSWSLGYDARSGKHKWTSTPVADGAGLLVRIFQDKNRNKSRDVGEPGLKGARIIIDGVASDQVADENGEIYIVPINATNVVTVALDLASIEDPMMKPLGEPLLRVYGRAGKTHYVNFPMIETGEVEGYIYRQSNGQKLPLKRCLVEAIGSDGQKISQARSQSDGYFIVENLPPGEWSIHLAETCSKSKKLRVSPATRLVTVPEEGGIFQGNDFVVQE